MKQLKLMLWCTFCTISLGAAICEDVRGQWNQYGGTDGDFRAATQTAVEFGTWSIELGVGDAAPIVDQGLVFVSEAAFTEEGQEAMRIRCLRPSSGETIWSTTVNDRSYISQDINDNYPVRPLASPIAAANRIVAISYGGCISCLDQMTGKLVWIHDLVQEFQATPIQYGFASSPWSDGSRVVIACGGAQALVIAFDLADGKVAWKTSPAEAAYGSFASLKLDDGSNHLVYMAQDAVIGIDPQSGAELWSYPLPKSGLTNAVSPLAIGKNELIVGGQGFDSSRRLKVQKKDDGTWKIAEIWTSKQTPFYCNCVVGPGSRDIIGYRSNALSSISFETGELKWRVRGWTDANFAIDNETIVGIRGDGFLALAQLTDDGMAVKKGARVVKDRVWAPPVIVNKTALIRGRHTLSAVALERLPAIDQLPSGTTIDSMTAMYGEKHESIVNLLNLASKEPTKLNFDDYRRVVEDRSILFGEGDYRALLGDLEKAKQFNVLRQIAKDWANRDPNSIVAFDKLVEAAKAQGDEEAVAQLTRDRLVEIVVEVRVPEATADDATVYLAGNASAVGSWRPNGFLLKRTGAQLYQGTTLVPKGQFEFKFSQGSWDTAEVRLDGRSTSNRRQLVKQPVTIRAEVLAWKSKVEK
ncbi:MAG: PQQ-binding-like beta-propeller repeat protein [Pirellulaceae bacterium]|nr:PQQ-binding-like beta-propeller repeat protein [Pirellulaceae bacterium]